MSSTLTPGGDLLACNKYWSVKKYEAPASRLGHVFTSGRMPTVLLWAGVVRRGQSPARSLRLEHRAGLQPNLWLVLIAPRGKVLALLLENTFMQHERGAVRHRDYPLVCHVVGKPVAVDAAQCDSYAHRLRCFWTNLVDTILVASVFQCAVRCSPDMYMDSSLDPGRIAAPVRGDEHCNWEGWFPCNKAAGGSSGRRNTFLTLMATVATVQSYNFRPGKSGSIYKAGSPPKAIG
jgi:hypothetical protein